jgi:hypothetical protein
LGGCCQIKQKTNKQKTKNLNREMAVTFLLLLLFIVIILFFSGPVVRGCVGCFRQPPRKKKNRQARGVRTWGMPPPTQGGILWVLVCFWLSSSAMCGGARHARK